MNIILSKENFCISEVLIHILGKDNAYTLTLMTRLWEKSKRKDGGFLFSQADAKEYQINRRKLDSIVDYLTTNDIISVENTTAGKLYFLIGDTIARLNYVIHLFEGMNFRKKIPNNMIRKNFNLEAIIKKGEKFQ